MAIRRPTPAAERPVTSSRPISLQSCASAACRSASRGSPGSLNQWAARRWRSGATAGRDAQRWRSIWRSRAWYRNQVRPGPRPTTKVFDAARSSRSCWPRVVGQLLGEGRVEPLDDRGAQEELLHVRRMPGQHLLGEELDHRVVLPPEVGGPVPGWSRVRNRAASRSPAGQPSVRSTSSSASPARSTTPSLATSAPRRPRQGEVWSGPRPGPRRRAAGEVPAPGRRG